MQRLLSVFLGALVLFCVSVAFGAGVPQKINYQAVLLDDLGDPVTDPVDITFTIYDTEVRGAILWQQTITGIDPDDNGQFSVILGDDITPITDDVLNGEQRWLGIHVSGDPDEMSPRTELVSSTYSFRVNTVDGAAAGTIYGPLTVEESLAKAADAEVNVSCSAKSPYSVQISPCNETVLKALDGTDAIGEWGISAPGQSYIAMTDFSAKAAGASVQIKAPSAGLPDAFTIANSSGDETFQIASDGSSASVDFFSAAKAASLKARVATEGFALFGDAESDEILNIEEASPGVATATWTDYSAKAAGASVQIKAPRTGFPEAFTIANSNGDATFEIESDPADSAASISIYSTAGAKDSRRRRRILFNRDGFFVFGATEGETAAVITTAGDIGMLELNKRSGEPGDERRVKFEPDGVYFLNATKQETTMIIHADGSIKGKGQIAMGQNVSNDGDYANVLGFSNTASGDSAAALGGWDNVASGQASAIIGGQNNSVSGSHSFATGYMNTVSGLGSTVSGGLSNNVAGMVGTIGGGTLNTVDNSSLNGTIAGGSRNFVDAGGGSIGGGEYCSTFATYATVPGGSKNTAGGFCSLAAGRRAKVQSGDDGTFIWADHTDADFASTDENQFLIRASNGVGINLNDPTEDLDVAGTARLRGIANTVIWTYPYVVVNPSTGKLYRRDSKSSRRYKKDIRELGIDGDKILQMEPVRFAWKENDMEDVGLIAEDVAKLIPELVIYDEENRPDAVRYDKVVIYLLAALKDLRAENEALKGQLGELSKAVETILATQNQSKSGDDKLTLNR